MHHLLLQLLKPIYFHYTAIMNSLGNTQVHRYASLAPCRASAADSHFPYSRHNKLVARQLSLMMQEWSSWVKDSLLVTTSELKWFFFFFIKRNCSNKLCNGRRWHDGIYRNLQLSRVTLFFSLSSCFLWKEMPLWKATYTMIQPRPWKILINCWVVENKTHVKLSFGWLTP